MDSISWLETNAPSFSRLPDNDRIVVMHFALLWSFFEAQALSTNASAASIETHVKNLANSNRLTPRNFEGALSYFRDRYVSDNRVNATFLGLRFRSNDKRDLVEAVLTGKDRDPVDETIALFLIIFRIRNNYFHGTKWTDDFTDQVKNFAFANSSIVMIMEMGRTHDNPQEGQI